MKILINNMLHDKLNQSISVINIDDIIETVYSYEDELRSISTNTIQSSLNNNNQPIKYNMLIIPIVPGNEYEIMNKIESFITRTDREIISHIKFVEFLSTQESKQFQYIDLLKTNVIIPILKILLNFYYMLHESNLSILSHTKKFQSLYNSNKDLLYYFQDYYNNI